MSRFSDDMEQCSCPAATIQLAGVGRGRRLPTCLSAASGLALATEKKNQIKSRSTASLLSFTFFGEQLTNCFLTTEWLFIN